MIDMLGATKVQAVGMVASFKEVRPGKWRVDPPTCYLEHSHHGKHFDKCFRTKDGLDWVRRRYMRLVFTVTNGKAE